MTKSISVPTNLRRNTSVVVNIKNHNVLNMFVTPYSKDSMLLSDVRKLTDHNIYSDVLERYIDGHKSHVAPLVEKSNKDVDLAK